MGQGQQTYPLRGGLDQETAAVSIPPGRAIACLNHEAEPNGYKRTQGYERYDGRPAPSDETISTINFTNGNTAFVAGDTVVGATSKATARVIAVVVTSGTYGGSNAAGYLVVHRIGKLAGGGVFLNLENLKFGSLAGAVYAVAASGVVAIDLTPPLSAQNLAWLVAAQTYARSQIAAPVGDGTVRGVLIFNGALYCWRDNVGASAGQIFAAGSGGWTALGLGSSMKFSTGLIMPPLGSTIVGGTSGATAKVRMIALDSGDWGAGAAGQFIVDTVTGVWQVGELIKIAGVTQATVVSIPVAVAVAPGGVYEFDIFNFYASEGYERAYGISKIERAFEFDGAHIAFMDTGLNPDIPWKVAEHKNQLLLATPGGTMMNSVVGQPRNFSGTLGAAEIGLGGPATNLISNTDDVMLIFTEKRLYALTGNDSSDFTLSPQGGPDSGAFEYTAQRIGQVIYLDRGGVRSIATGAFYGNFKLGTFTSLIVKELERKRAAGVNPTWSCVVKSKSQYLLFFDDGSGISIFFGLKQPEAMLFKYPFVVTCGAVGQFLDKERVFVGCLDGFVYELNKGTSFDGAVIDAFVQMPYHHSGDPRLPKRYQHLSLEFEGDVGSTLGLVTRYDYGGSEQPLSQVDNDTLLAAMGVADHMAAGSVVYGESTANALEFYIDGMGCNMSPTFFSSSSTMESYTLCSISLAFKPRGHKR